MGKVAVTGPYGRLGSELVERGCIPIETSVTDLYALNQNILDINPDVIIHTAAKTNVDMCEVSTLDAMKVNAWGTSGLSQVFSGKIVYISTDYIFDGENGPYTEDDKPSPISIYGWSKLGGEIALKNRENAEDLIIRTTVLFDKHSPNFVTAIAGKMQAGEPVHVPATLYGSPTYTPHLAEGILQAVDLNMAGVLNITGDRVLSRFEFAWEIGKWLGVNVDALVFAGPVTGRAPRPLKAGLLVDKAKALGLSIYSPFEGVREVVKNGVEAMAIG